MGDQSRDLRPNLGQLDDKLFDILQTFDRTVTLRAALERRADGLVNVILGRRLFVGALVAGLSAGPTLIAVLLFGLARLTPKGGTGALVCALQAVDFLAKSLIFLSKPLVFVLEPLVFFAQVADLAPELVYELMEGFGVHAGACPRP